MSLSFCDLKSLLIKLISISASVLLGIMAVLYMAQVVFRYCIASPIVWADELAGYMMVWVVFLGSVLALRERTHINIDLLWKFLPPKPRKFLIWTCDIFVMVFAVTLTVNGYKLIKGSLGMRTTSIDIPYAPVYSIMFISGTLMIIVMIFNWFKDKK
jgi:TRAP-type C4-dicarboxylate transport system permease small subunit